MAWETIQKTNEMLHKANGRLRKAKEGVRGQFIIIKTATPEGSGRYIDMYR